jgi:hypothetical protein
MEGGAIIERISAIVGIQCEKYNMQSKLDSFVVVIDQLK